MKLTKEQIDFARDIFKDIFPEHFYKQLENVEIDCSNGFRISNWKD